MRLLPNQFSCLPRVYKILICIMRILMHYEKVYCTSPILPLALTLLFIRLPLQTQPVSPACSPLPLGTLVSSSHDGPISSTPQARMPLRAQPPPFYTLPTSFARLACTHSRTSFYPGPTDDTHVGWGRVRDTFSFFTVTTLDTDTVCMVPHLLHTMAESQPSTSHSLTPTLGLGLGMEMEMSSQGVPLAPISEHGGSDTGGNLIGLEIVCVGCERACAVPIGSASANNSGKGNGHMRN
jgi:hypothetical protein